jgi:YVTN family beta-propeller protein
MSSVRRAPIAVLIACAVVAGCSSESTSSWGGSAPVVLVVSPTSAQLSPGDSIQLSVGALDEQGRLVTGVPVTFHASDTAIIQVTPVGVVRSRGPLGSATVTVSGAGLVATVTITVVGTGPPPIDTAQFQRVYLPATAFGVATSFSGAVYVTLPFSGQVARVNAVTATMVRTITVGSVPTNVVFNPAGSRAYVSNQNSDAISIIDVAKDSVVDFVAVTGDPVPMAVSADGQSLFVATNANVLFKVDLGTKAVLGSVTLPATAHHVALNADRSRLYVSTRDGGTVMEVSTATMAVLRTFAIGGRTQGLVVTADSSELWVANEFANIQVWSLQTGTLVGVVGVTGSFGMASTANDASIYATIPATGQVKVISRASRSVVKTVLTGGTPRITAFDPGTSRVVVASEGGWLDILR